MRIGIMVDEIRFGGVEKVAIEEARALNKIGHKAVLIVLRRTDSNAFREQLFGVQRIFFSDLLPRPLRFSFKFPFFRFFSLFHLTYAFFARFVFVHLSLDAIIAHGTYTCFSGWAMARARRIPFISFVWDPITYILSSSYFRSGSRWKSFLLPISLRIGTELDRWICRGSTAILTGSSYHLSRLNNLVSSHEKVKLLHPGVHVRRNLRPERRQYAILATAWKEGKEPEYVLELANRMKYLQFVLAGAWISQTMKNQFLSETERLDENRVSVVGSITEDSLQELYSQALVFLQIKGDTGFGLPALEAAGQGCTFIIPEGQGVCDIFIDGEDGFMVREKDTQEIVEHLQQLLDNPLTAFQMGENAWKKARAHSWQTHAECLVKIVQQCISYGMSKPDHKSECTP